MKHEESQLQIACVKACDEYFRLKWPEAMVTLKDSKKRLYSASPLVATPNERNASIQAGRRMKAMGRRAGYPDLKLEVRRHGYSALYIELKTEKGRVSYNQESWRQHLTSVSGGMFVIVRSLDAFMTVIRNYMEEE